ncbi:hypothetical protein [Lysinibacillus piscis]|nr:hypothetical protein [Lysinibacillus sp. KH24]
MTKRRWRLLIFAAIILIIGFTMQQREKSAEDAIAAILDNAVKRDGLELSQGEQVLANLTGNEAVTYMEAYPLSHIKTLNKKERAIFEEKPAYHLVYLIEGKPLYEVDVLRVAINSELEGELKDMVFTMNEQQYVLYWAKQKKVLEQSSNTQKLLEQYVK